MQHETQVTSYTSEGEGVGKTTEGKTLFIPGALVGEEILVKVTEDKKRFAKASLVKIKHASSNRTIPPCVLFERCGGCSVMHMNEQEQLHAKESRVKDSLSRLSHFPQELVLPISAIPKRLHYRTKITLHYSKHGWGYYAKKSRSIVPVHECPIFEFEGQTLILALQRHIHDPLIQEATLRVSQSTQEQLLILHGRASRPPIDAWFRALSTLCPNLKGIVYQPEKGKVSIVGTSHLTQTICDTPFIYPYDGFFQIFPQAASELFTYAIEAANLKPQDHVIDAHCGVGVISLLAAPYVHKVEGWEVVQRAIEYARLNAKNLKLSNVTFTKGAIPQKRRTCTTLFLNPPRGGCLPDLLQMPLAETIVYISCNPATLARDLKELTKSHELIFVKPFDLFPQTMHVESVALLRAK